MSEVKKGPLTTRWLFSVTGTFTGKACARKHTPTIAHHIAKTKGYVAVTGDLGSEMVSKRVADFAWLGEGKAKTDWGMCDKILCLVINQLASPQE